MNGPPVTRARDATSASLRAGTTSCSSRRRLVVSSRTRSKPGDGPHRGIDVRFVNPQGTACAEIELRVWSDADPYAFAGQQVDGNRRRQSVDLEAEDR